MRFWDEIRFFRPEEWRNDPAKASPELVWALDHVREMAGIPINIHVCYAASGHSEHSLHLTGKAVDFHFGKGRTHAEEFTLLRNCPEFGGVGFYPEWLPRPGWHVDIRMTPVFWVCLHGHYHYGLDEIERAMELLT